MDTKRLFLVAGGLLGATACDYSGDWLFAGAVDGVPGVVHLGELTPADIVNPGDVADAAIYGEVGPTGTTEPGGVTFTFDGTGGNVCIWVDPELVYYNHSVATRPVEKFSYPDNVFDDGDLDLSAGLAAYYNGSPGERVGDFEVRYTDGLGNPVTVALNECQMASQTTSTGAHAGRGAPEYCTIFNTQPGVSYLVLMEVWSTPLDDDRLGYGMLLANGDCADLHSPGPDDECFIVGEAIDTSAPDAPGPWTGRDNVPSRAGSDEFERVFCDARGDLAGFCEAEALQNDCTDPENQCYCGNPEDTPRAGSF